MRIVYVKGTSKHAKNAGKEGNDPSSIPFPLITYWGSIYAWYFLCFILFACHSVILLGRVRLFSLFLLISRAFLPFMIYCHLMMPHLKVIEKAASNLLCFENNHKFVIIDKLGDLSIESLLMKFQICVSKSKYHGWLRGLEGFLLV